MNYEKTTTNLFKSSRVMAYSSFIFALLSNFIEISIAIVPAFSILFAIFYFEKNFNKAKIKIDYPLYKFFNYSVPFILTLLFFFLIYIKKYKEIEIPPVMFILIISPVFYFMNKLILSMINFPTNVGMYGISEKNYQIILDFKNKQFFAFNDYIKFNEDLIIENTKIKIYQLPDLKYNFEKSLNKSISEMNSDELNLASIYNY